MESLKENLITFRVDTHFKELLKKVSEETGLSISFLIRYSFIAGIQNEEIQEELKEIAELLRLRDKYSLARLKTKLMLQKTTHKINALKLLRKLERQGIGSEELREIKEALEEENKVYNEGLSKLEFSELFNQLKIEKVKKIERVKKRRNDKNGR